MVALPVIGVSAADLTLRSSELSPEQTLSRRIGAADARMELPLSGRAVLQSADGTDYLDGVTDGGDRDKFVGSDLTGAVLAATVPAGAETVRDTTGKVKAQTAHGLLGTEVRELDAAQPLAAGIVTRTGGRLPAAAGEVAATDAFLEASGLAVGSEVTVRGVTRPYRITGSYELPSALRQSQLLAPDGSVLAPLDQAQRDAGLSPLFYREGLLVKVGGAGFTWDMVKEANAKGAGVVSRAVITSPPADADVPYLRQKPDFGDGNRYGLSPETITVTLVMMALLEVCLLAGPAFAVGVRRSRRQLGLVGANGGDRRHIRAIVLSGGLVIGAAAAVIGTVIGIALTLGLRPVLEQAVGMRFGGFDARPLELLGIAALAVVTGLLAAVLPAITASRQSVLISLTGRRGVRRSHRLLPFVGLVAVALGAAVTVWAALGMRGTMTIAAGSALAELGVVALTPTLVGLFGRFGRWLPLSPRLALRDSVRNRSRTAPAVAAVLAAVAGTVAVATYQHSHDLRDARAYVAKLPAGSGRLLMKEAAGHRDVPAARTALADSLPVAVQADVDRITVGPPDCAPSSREPGCGRVELIPPKEQRCPLTETRQGSSAFPEDQQRELRRDPRCADPVDRPDFPVLVADEKLLTALGVTDPGAVAALKAGTPVSLDSRNHVDGKVTVRVVDNKYESEHWEPGKNMPGQDKVVQVYQVPQGVQGYGVQLILPPAAAKAAGLATAPYGAYFTLADGAAGSAQRQAMDARLGDLGSDTKFMIENGYESPVDVRVLALTVFAGLITLGAAGIATGLAQADAEADLRTLAAVGATRRVRRTLSGFQCGVVALMGVILGSVAGLLPAAGLLIAERTQAARFGERLGEAVPVPIGVPWETVGALLVVVPLGAALLAALVTRSSGSVARRATS
ncbi:FtsX-like permease family protein [Streptomyces sp. IBSNAI002]|uniref:FtsX-like permease family protein n=1 Tax=Streptomyces sp. IBSNAI002 TaxID=3457500 RepID=UPI003FD2CA9A